MSQDDCFGGGNGLQNKPRRMLCETSARTTRKETSKDGLGCKSGVAWGPFLLPLGFGVLVNEDQEKTTTVDSGRDTTWFVGASEFNYMLNSAGCVLSQPHAQAM